VRARAVRAGGRVLLTTHSDFLLAELSNCIRRSRAGRDEDIALLPDAAGAYWFSVDAATGISHAQELPITAEEGIPEEGFMQASDDLYEETAFLQAANVFSR